jgi:DNA-binding transcriptional MerR regulator
MAHYSIKDLEKITGIKAHTIRIWEKRYGIVEPMRTDSNIRYYCDSELKKLMNISILLKYGFKISKLAGLDQAELNNKIQEVSIIQNGHDTQIESLVVSMIELDEKKFNKILTQLLIKEGFEKTIFNVLYPFFDRIGVLWQTGSINPAQEHFISNLVKQKVYVAIDGVQVEPKPDARTFILFLPEWEQHELGLLVYNYMIKSRGQKVVYLGQSVPYEDLGRVAEIHKPDYIFTSFSFGVEEGKLKSYVEDLARDFSGSQVLITGHQTKDLTGNLPKNVAKVDSLMCFRDDFLSKF